MISRSIRIAARSRLVFGHAARRRFARRLSLQLPLAAALFATLACHEGAASLGSSAASARGNADAMLSSLSARFGPRRLDPTFARARPKLAESALIPSRIFDDKEVWTSMGNPARTLELVGSGGPGQYSIAARANAPAPAKPGDYRQETHLARLDKDQYEWTVRDELAIGTITAADLDRALTTIFAAAERRDEGALRAEYRSLMPRATSALGRLFSLDSVRFGPSRDGATAVYLVLTVHPDGVEREFPKYAKYLRKYVSPVTFNVFVYDDEGHRWWQAQGDKERVSLSFRVHGGSLAPLDASPRRIPENVHVQVDASTKAWLFKVGLKQLVGDVALTREANEKAFIARFRCEPDWQLPPFVEQMIRTPLHRPFEGGGAVLTFAVRDSAGAQTLATREFRLAVQESKIMRWFGGLGNSALNDFREGAEEEFDRFNGETLGAVHADLLTITAP